MIFLHFLLNDEKKVVYLQQIIVKMLIKNHKSTPQLVRNYYQLPSMEESGKFLPITTTARLNEALGTAAEWIWKNRFAYYAPFQLQRFSGCRAREAWIPERWGVNEDWQETLSSCKNSDERTFTDEDTDKLQPYLYETYTIIRSGFTYDNYRRVCRQAMRQAGVFMVDVNGIPYGSTHILRHAFAKKLLWGGMSKEMARQYMGEKTIKSFDIYATSTIFQRNLTN